MSYFTDALSSFTTEVAYKEAIRKLYKQGLTIPEIIDACMYPVTEEMAKKVIDEYEKKKDEPGSHFVEEIDQYGRRSFRKVTK